MASSCAASSRRVELRHGGEYQRVELAEADVAIAGPSDDMLALDEVLQQFEHDQPRKAALVKLRYFAGLSEAEAAAALGISCATAARWWAFARAWLYDRCTVPMVNRDCSDRGEAAGCIAGRKRYGFLEFGKVLVI